MPPASLNHRSPVLVPRSRRSHAASVCTPSAISLQNCLCTERNGLGRAILQHLEKSGCCYDALTPGCVQMADSAANQTASRSRLGSWSDGQATKVRQTASPLVVAELVGGQFRLVADRPLATGVPRRPSPSSMTMSPWSDSLQRRGPEDLAFAPTWPR